MLTIPHVEKIEYINRQLKDTFVKSEWVPAMFPKIRAHVLASSHHLCKKMSFNFLLGTMSYIRLSSGRRLVEQETILT